jgi:hypothetical protein
MSVTAWAIEINIKIRGRAEMKADFDKGEKWREKCQ